MQTPPIPGQRAVDTTLLIEHLRTKQPGDLVTYGELQSVVGKSCAPGDAAYSNLLSARRAVMRESRIHFVTVAREGIQCVHHEEATRFASNYTSRARTMARRGREQLAAVDFAALSNQGKLLHTTEAAILGAMEIFGRSASRKKVLTAVEKSSDKSISYEATLRLFENGARRDVTDPTRHDETGPDGTGHDMTGQDKTLELTAAAVEMIGDGMDSHSGD